MPMMTPNPFQENSMVADIEDAWSRVEVWSDKAKTRYEYSVDSVLVLRSETNADLIPGDGPRDAWPEHRDPDVPLTVLDPIDWPATGARRERDVPAAYRIGSCSGLLLRARSTET